MGLCLSDPSAIGKVLWVVNTVDEAIRLADAYEARPFEPMVYHSRFRYMDRVERHKEVIGAFKGPGPVLAFCTQVAEMSLDISADLLVTQLAPIPALIQRLGRLNRRATGDDPWPFIVTYRDLPAPSRRARRRQSLVGYAGRRRHLTTRPRVCLDRPGENRNCGVSVHLARRRLQEPPWSTSRWRPLALRSSWPRTSLTSAPRRSRPELVRIPMTMPRSRDWREWPEIAFCKVPPAGFIDYDPRRGTMEDLTLDLFAPGMGTAPPRRTWRPGVHARAHRLAQEPVGDRRRRTPARPSMAGRCRRARAFLEALYACVRPRKGMIHLPGGFTARRHQSLDQGRTPTRNVPHHPPVGPSRKARNKVPACYPVRGRRPQVDCRAPGPGRLHTSRSLARSCDAKR